jgi:ribosome recycling factor
MLEGYVKELTPKLDKSVEFLEDELNNIHTGRANVSLVDDILVNVYGTKQPLKSVANINIPEARQILIQPWDKGVVSQIEAAVREAGLGFNPINTGDVIRINLPELTQERRREFVKLAKEKTEEARVGIRTSRGEIWNTIKKAKNEGEISEDDMYHNEAEIQKLVDTYNKKVEDIFAKKEKELLEI